MSLRRSDVIRLAAAALLAAWRCRRAPPRTPNANPTSATLAMGKLLQARGDSVFLLDRTQSPAKLDVSFHNEVSWSGLRR